MSVRKIELIAPLQQSDVTEMFHSNVKFKEIFRPVQHIQDNFCELLKKFKRDIEAKAEALMKDGEQEEFLVPQVPKPKRDVREKTESRVTKKTSVRSNVDVADSMSSVENNSTFRRSARVASKKKTMLDSFLAPPPPPPLPSLASKPIHNISTVASPSMPPLKMRRTSNGQSSKASITKPLSDSLCTLDMKEPLGSSTPTDNYVKKEISVKPSTPVKMIVSSPKTPVCEINRQIKGDSVKKRVEEFEKKAAISKFPIATPERKKFNSSPSKSRNKTNDASNSKSICKIPLFPEKDLSAMKHRCTRNTSKILQEKSANIKLIEEKGEKAQKKKEVIIKKSAEEAKRKREERSRKVAAQREAHEKEKLETALKLEKEKEEKIKTLQKQKEDKLRSECLKKKQAAASKATEAEERRKKEEALKAAKLKEAETKLEDYGIDHVSDNGSSEEEDKPKKQIPAWAMKENRRHALQVQAYLNKKRTVHPWFYNENLKHPKLEELFSSEVKMRPRTSSMYWNTMIDFNESFPLK